MNKYYYRWRHHKLAVCIPAILDLDVIKTTTAALKKNLIDNNLDFVIELYVSLDNYQRQGCTGTFDQIKQCYAQLEAENCNVNVIITGNRLGLNLNYKLLMKKFIDSDCNYCVFIDDDYELINKIDLSDIFSGLSEDSFLHLAACKKEKDTSFSHENPFVIDVVHDKSNTTTLYKNNRNFYTLPGTFFTKKQAKEIYDEVNFAKEEYSAEDLVGKCKAFKKHEIITAFFRTGDMIFKSGNWILPLKNHFIYDNIRAASGKSAVELKDYNP